MPLLILTWSAWLFGASGLPTSACGSAVPSVTTATAEPIQLLVAPASTGSPADRLPLWCEAEEEEERDDDSESAATLTILAPWPVVGACFGPTTGPTNPALRPRSAVRSPILRC